MSAHVMAALPVPAIAHTSWNRRIYYVSHLPSNKPGCASFGFTSKLEGTPNPNYPAFDSAPLLDVALALSPYWQRRFAARCRAIGDPCVFIPAHPALAKVEAAQ